MATLSMRDAEFWANLTQDERRELMSIQTSPSYGRGSAYLPDDCSECGCCGEPILGSGWCAACYERYERLMAKGRGEKKRPPSGCIPEAHKSARGKTGQNA